VTARLLTWLVGGALLASSAGATPPPPPRPPPRPAPGLVAEAPKAAHVEVRILVVHATSSHNRVDARLQNLTRFLSHLRYTGYDLLQTHTAVLAVNGKQTFNIEGGLKVTVELVAKEGTRVRLHVQMMRGATKLLETTLTVNRNGTAIVAGPKHGDGILVLPLTASY
jgi:hypothetical protein